MSIIQSLLNAVSFIPPDATDLLEFDDYTTTPPPPPPPPPPPFPPLAPPPNPSDPLRYIGPIPSTIPEDAQYSISISSSLPKDFHPDTGGIPANSNIIHRLNSVIYHDFPKKRSDNKFPEFGVDVDAQPFPISDEYPTSKPEETAWQKALLSRLNNVAGCEDNALGVKGRLDYPNVKSMKACVGYLRSIINVDTALTDIGDEYVADPEEGYGGDEDGEIDEEFLEGFEASEVENGGFKSNDDVSLKKVVKMGDAVKLYDPVDHRDIMRKPEWRNHQGWNYSTADDDGDSSEDDEGTDEDLSKYTALKSARRVRFEDEDTSMEDVSSPSKDDLRREQRTSSNESYREEESIDTSLKDIEPRSAALAASNLYARKGGRQRIPPTPLPEVEDEEAKRVRQMHAAWKKTEQMMEAKAAEREKHISAAYLAPNRTVKDFTRKQQDARDAKGVFDATFDLDQDEPVINKLMRNEWNKKKWQLIPIYKLNRAGVSSWYLLLVYHDAEHDLLRIRIWSPSRATAEKRALQTSATRLSQFMLRELCPPTTKLWCRTTYGPLESSFHPNSAVEIFARIARILSKLEMFCSRKAGLGIMFRHLRVDHRDWQPQSSRELELYRQQMFNAVRIWDKRFHTIRENQPMHLPAQMLETIQTICGHHGSEIFKALLVLMDRGARGVLIGHSPDPDDNNSSSGNPRTTCSGSSLLDGGEKTCKCRIKIIPVVEGSMVLLDGDNIERTEAEYIDLDIQRDKALNKTLNLSNSERQFTEFVLNNPSATIAIYADYIDAQGEKNVYIKAGNSFNTSWEINGQTITQSEFLGPIPHISFLACGSRTRWLWLGKIEDPLRSSTKLPILADFIQPKRDRVLAAPWSEVRPSNREHVLHHHHRPSYSTISTSSQPAQKLWAAIPPNTDVIQCTNHRCFAKGPTSTTDKTIGSNTCDDINCKHRKWGKECNKRCWSSIVPHNPSRKWVPPVGVVVHKPVLLNTMDAPMKDGEPMRELAKVHGPSAHFLPPIWFMPISWQPSDGFIDADTLSTTHPNATGDPHTGHVFDDTNLVDLEVKRLDLWNSIPEAHKERIWDRGKDWLDNNPTRIKRVLSSDQMGLRKAKRRKVGGGDGSGLRGWLNPMSYFGGKGEEKTGIAVSGGFGDVKVDVKGHGNAMREGRMDIDFDLEENEEWTLDEEYWSPEPVPLKPLGQYKKPTLANPIDRLKFGDKKLRNNPDDMDMPLSKPTAGWRPKSLHETTVSKKRRIDETLDRLAKRQKYSLDAEDQENIFDLAEALSDIAIEEDTEDSPRMKKIPRVRAKRDIQEEDYGKISLPKYDTPQKRKYHEYIEPSKSESSDGRDNSDNLSSDEEEPSVKKQKVEANAPLASARLGKSAPEVIPARQNRCVSSLLPKSTPTPTNSNTNATQTTEGKESSNHSSNDEQDNDSSVSMDISDEDSESETSENSSSFTTTSSEETNTSEESDTSQEEPTFYEKCLSWL